MGVSPCLSSTMLDLSQASVEYVCKNVTSPNIARRFGHKLNDVGGIDRQYVRATSQDPHIQSHSYRSRQDVQRSRSSVPSYTSSHISTTQNCYRGQVKSLHEGHETISYPQLSNSQNTDRALTNRVNSWLKDPSRAVLPSTGIKSKLSEIPKIFIYHQSTLKNYLKSWH